MHRQKSITNCATKQNRQIIIRKICNFTLVSTSSGEKVDSKSSTEERSTPCMNEQSDPFDLTPTS